MQKKSVLLFTLIAGLGIANLASATEAASAGRKIAFDRSEGNCLSCHAIPGDPEAESAGNIGPPLAMIKERYPDRAKLRAQIWDPTQANPRSSMPPFGKHRILSEQQIDQVVEYVQGL